ncbi:MAG: PdxA family protein [bacterium]
MIFSGPPAVREKINPGLPNFKGKDSAEVCWQDAGEIKFSQVSSGNINPASGRAAMASLRAALKITDELKSCSLLTLPLSKAAVQAGGQANFLGHTEYLEEHWSTIGVMSFFAEKFNVALLTRHCPLVEVSKLLTRQKITRTVKICWRFFKKKFTPRFALLGLNPHSGEQGLIGREEEEILKPAVRELCAEDIKISGPYPADSFLPINSGEVDMIFACYHDQGLVPFKQLHFFTGIQATLGLPILRVSPDHGTAAALAGKGRVDPRSTINCLKWLRSWNTAPK